MATTRDLARFDRAQGEAPRDALCRRGPFARHDGQDRPRPGRVRRHRRSARRRVDGHAVQVARQLRRLHRRLRGAGRVPQVHGARLRLQRGPVAAQRGRRAGRSDRSGPRAGARRAAPRDVGLFLRLARERGLDTGVSRRHAGRSRSSSAIRCAACCSPAPCSGAASTSSRSSTRPFPSTPRGCAYSSRSTTPSRSSGTPSTRSQRNSRSSSTAIRAPARGSEALIMPNTGPAIVVDRLCKRYGALRAVDDISFTVKSGEVFAFLGPNGAGKSTTAEVIETIRVPTSGTVTVLGMDVTKRKAGGCGGSACCRRTSARSTASRCARACSTTPACSDAAPTSTRYGSHQSARQVRGPVQHALGRPEAAARDRRRAGQRSGDRLSRRAHDRSRPPRTAPGLGQCSRGLKGAGKTVFLTTHYMEEAELLGRHASRSSRRGGSSRIDSPARLTEQHADPMRLTLKSIDASAVGVIRNRGLFPSWRITTTSASP